MTNKVEIDKLLNTMIDEIHRLTARVTILELKNGQDPHTIERSQLSEVDNVTINSVKVLDDDTIKNAAIDLVLKNKLTNHEKLKVDYSLQALLYRTLKTLDFEQFNDLINGIYFSFLNKDIRNPHAYINKTLTNALEKHYKEIKS